MLRNFSAGGVQRVMLDLAGAFAQAGHETDLLVCRAHGAMSGQLPAGVRLVELPSARRSEVLRALVRTDPLAALRLAWAPLPSTLRALPGMVNYYARARPAAVLSATVYVNLMATWARALAGSDARLVLSEHTHPSARLRAQSGVQRRALPGMMARGYRRASAVVAVSHGIAADLAARRGIPARHLHVVYNPIRPAAGTAYPVPHPWLRAGEPPVVLGVGRLYPQKSLEVLLHAFAQLRRQRPARLLVLGEGPQRGALEGLAGALGIEADVALPGFVPDPYPYFAHAGVFALSSRYEGLPLALIEALACGCPVVSTDCPSGPDEILQGGRHGALVPVDDPTALAVALAATLARPRDPEPLRRRAAEFSPQRAASAYLDLLLGSAPAPGVPVAPTLAASI